MNVDINFYSLLEVIISFVVAYSKAFYDISYALILEILSDSYNYNYSLKNDMLSLSSSFSISISYLIFYYFYYNLLLLLILPFFYNFLSPLFNLLIFSSYQF